MPQIMPKVWTSNISASVCGEERRQRERGTSVANCDRPAEGSVKKTAEIETGGRRHETRDRRDLVLISSVQTEIM